MNREEARDAALRQAQAHAAELFATIEAEGILRPGVTEGRINEEIYALAHRLYGIGTYWHKRIVRAGPNTLLPYAENPPDLVVADDDILFLDLGPVFEQWEADFGRTFVLGDDPVKRRLCNDTARAFAQGKAFFHAQPDITGAGLFQHAVDLAASYGWEFGGEIAGHLIGQFPHERIPDDKVSLYVHPGNPRPMRAPDANGRPRHWILEIHFVDRARRIGAFYEELLTL